MSSLNQNATHAPTKDGNVQDDRGHGEVVATGGRDLFWRSVNELLKKPKIKDQIQNEFPDVATMDPFGLNRRQFARLMAASLALAGLGVSGCRRWPEQTIRPQSERKEGYLPGVAQYFASQFELGGVATGILVKSVDGRPVKIEGNDLHPFSQGAVGTFAQASVLELYDPDRTRGYIHRPGYDPATKDAGENLSDDQVGKPIQYPKKTFESVARAKFAALQKSGGRGLHVLTQANSSPTFKRLRDQFRQKFPESRWYVYQPLDRDDEYAGEKLAFGDVVRTQYDLGKAKTIVCLEADLLGVHPGHLRWCRQWAKSRNPDAGEYSRLWALESGYSVTGAAADYRVPVSSTQLIWVIKAIAGAAGFDVGEVPLQPQLQSQVARLWDELRQNPGRSLLVAGPSQPPAVHAWVHGINQGLQNVGTTVWYTAEPLAESSTCTEAISNLVGALRGKSVDTLLILGGNPIYDAPADLPLELEKQTQLTSIHVGLFDNETARQCTWHVPEAHFLEAWNDGRAWDGTYGIGQPLIYPLFDGISQIEMLSLALGQPVENGMSLVRETAKTLGVDDDRKWNRLLHDGVLEQSQFETTSVEINEASLSSDALSEFGAVAAKQDADRLEVCFVQDGSVWDGRFANNGWLQELPDSLTKLTWDNAALISKQDADRFSLANGDVISIANESLKLSGIPVLIQPGQAVGTISLPLGYGRETGQIAVDVGTNVYSIRRAQHRHRDWVQINRTGRHHQLATTQEHHLIDNVGHWGIEKRVGGPAKPGLLVRETTLDKHRENPGQVHEVAHLPPAAPLFDPPDKLNSPSAWGMAIDLNACIGCNACVIACQSENNIPIVGKANVLQNREMHWLRIDRYFKGDVEAPDTVHVPTACAHCEDAPCEQVCPVAATVHDTEGLNAMVYNRCVGTRYCANNCPYKVRRFNYFDFHASNARTPAQPWLEAPDQQQKKEISELEQMVFNPEVSVRMRGVMEKCTYCVQRISNARIAARNEYAKGKRESSILNDGEVMTACQQVCPTQAIRFGDLNDKDSNVSKAHQDARAYSMLEETNIKPRTRFLAKIRNVDSNDHAEEEAEHGHH